MLPNAVCPSNFDCFLMTDCQPNAGTHSCPNYYFCKQWTYAWSLPYSYDFHTHCLTVLPYGYRYLDFDSRVVSDVYFRDFIRITWAHAGFVPAVPLPNLCELNPDYDPIPF